MRDHDANRRQKRTMNRVDALVWVVRMLGAFASTPAKYFDGAGSVSRILVYSDIRKYVKGLVKNF